MLLEDKIYQDYVTAMKAQDKAKIEFLSFVRAAFRNAAIDLKVKKLEDNDVIQVIQKMIKEHKESIAQFEKGNRVDLVDKEKKELAARRIV